MIEGCYQTAVAIWGLTPSDFWSMTPREWWLIYDSKMDQIKAQMRATSSAPSFDPDEVAEMRRMYQDGRGTPRTDIS